MKKAQLIILSTILTLTLFSCGKKGNDLVNKWQVTGIETAADLPDSLKNDMVANSTMTFSKDGGYNTSGGIGADQGTYTLNKEGDQLSTISSAGKSSEVYAIKKLDKDNLVLTNNGNTVTCISVN